MCQSFSSIRAHGPEQCRFCTCGWRLAPYESVRSCNRRAYALQPFHSITTTDSGESISNGLAESSSAVLNPPTLLPKDAGGRVWPWRGDPRRVGLFMTSGAARACRYSTARDLREARRPFQLLDALSWSCTAQPREHGSKSELNSSSWAQAVPVSRPQVGL